MFNDDKSLLNIPVNGTKSFTAVGNYVHVLEADGNVEIIAENTRTSVKTGKMRVSPNGGRVLVDECNKWTVKNISGAVQSVIVSVGTGRILDPQVNIAADVNALSETKNKTVDGNEFIASYYLGSVASNYNTMCLWNPADSGVIVDCHGGLLSAGGTHVTMYKEDDVTGFGSLLTWCYNKKVSLGYNAKAQFLFDTTPTGTASGNDAMGNMQVSSLYPKPLQISKEKPIELEPGEGLAFMTAAVSVNLALDIEWSERAAA